MLHVQVLGRRHESTPTQAPPLAGLGALRALILVYVLLWPIAKMLELFGLWPQLMFRGMARMMDQFKGYEPDEHDRYDAAAFA